MTRHKSDHVVIRMTPPNYTAICLHCTEQYEIKVPCSISLFTGILKTFGKEHKHCQPATNSGETAQSTNQPINQ